MSGGGAHWIAAPAFEQGGAFGFARNRAAFGRPFIPGAFRSGFLLRSPYAHWPRFARAYFRGGFGRHHDRSRGSIGWDGSLFWPYGYDDLLDYTLYPYAYDAFWPYAYDELYRGMSVLGSSSIGSAYATTGEPTANRAPVVDAGHVCTADVSSLTDWRINALADRMDLDETQRAARDELEAATARALPMLKAACPHGLPSTPIQRMDAMHAQVAAMLSTVRAVRAPLAVFYNLLHAPQKARLDALGAGESRRPQIARDLAGICREHSARVAGAPIERIERAVRPSDTQQASLQHLAASLTAAGDVLRSNCAGTDANSAVLRLEAIEHRLDAMLRAVEIVQPALEEFYGVLSPEQKQRFNSLTATAG